MDSQLRQAFRRVERRTVGRVQLAYERLRGIDTVRSMTLQDTGQSCDQANPYCTSGNRYLRKVLDSCQVIPDDTIVDLGSGKGGALITMARYPFREVAGVELSPKLHAVAERNMGVLGLKHVRLFCCDAAEFDALDMYNFVYTYHSFPRSVMAAVMCNLVSSLRSRPRLVRVIYLNPSAHDLVIGSGMFRKTGEFESAWEFPFYVYTSSV